MQSADFGTKSVTANFLEICSRGVQTHPLLVQYVPKIKIIIIIFHSRLGLWHVPTLQLPSNSWSPTSLSGLSRRDLKLLVGPPLPDGPKMMGRTKNENLVLYVWGCAEGLVTLPCKNAYSYSSQ